MKKCRIQSLIKTFLLVGIILTVMVGSATTVSAALIGGNDIISAPGSVIDDPPGATNDHQQAFNEKQGVLLTTDLTVDGGVIPAGTVINSHMIFLNTVGDTYATDTQAWTFDGKILGVMSDSPGNLEDASSFLLGHPDTTYPSAFPARGMEDNDEYVIVGNILEVKMTVTEPGDWIRVITDATKTLSIDIKPNSCPNPLNVKSKGVLPVAILGTEEFDVTRIDLDTVRLILDSESDKAVPLRWDFEDVATPFKVDKESCMDCTEEGSDGYTDLILKFKTQRVVELLGEVEDGDCVKLMITAFLKEEAGGHPCIGIDLVKIIRKMGGKP